MGSSRDLDCNGRLTGSLILSERALALHVG
jgi:hypothetical protein